MELVNSSVKIVSAKNLAFKLTFFSLVAEKMSFNGRVISSRFFCFQLFQSNGCLHFFIFYIQDVVEHLTERLTSIGFVFQ